VFTADLAHMRTIQLTDGLTISEECAAFELTVHDGELYVLHKAGGSGGGQGQSGDVQAITCFGLDGAFRRTVYTATAISCFAVVHDKLVVARAHDQTEVP
jgi:hypothetical protein